ncbi:MAG: hypothetical protein MUE99_05680 [Chitinophagaceae bacterium]|jgi:hypothetical protein|nr:hypothetical protein [Chitinophagaceae bacterium]
MFIFDSGLSFEVFFRTHFARYCYHANIVLADRDLGGDMVQEAIGILFLITLLMDARTRRQWGPCLFFRILKGIAISKLGSRGFNKETFGFRSG